MDHGQINFFSYSAILSYMIHILYSCQNQKIKPFYEVQVLEDLIICGGHGGWLLLLWLRLWHNEILTRQNVDFDFYVCRKVLYYFTQLSLGAQQPRNTYHLYYYDLRSMEVGTRADTDAEKGLYLLLVDAFFKHNHC